LLSVGDERSKSEGGARNPSAVLLIAMPDSGLGVTLQDPKNYASTKCTRAKAPYRARVRRMSLQRTPATAYGVTSIRREGDALVVARLARSWCIGTMRLLNCLRRRSTAAGSACYHVSDLVCQRCSGAWSRISRSHVLQRANAFSEFAASYHTRSGR
jgi:hypothetical protein